VAKIRQNVKKKGGWSWRKPFIKNLVFLKKIARFLLWQGTGCHATHATHGVDQSLPTSKTIIHSSPQFFRQQPIDTIYPLTFVNHHHLCNGGRGAIAITLRH